ncbi:hypothetical protein Q9R29_00170 [Rothia sp. ARF10]|nr:hypothetical protein [Rothia sp. ARF10]
MPDASSDPARPTQDEDATSDSVGTDAAPSSSAAVTEATAAVERRELWVARDLLAAHVREERDVEALRLLGEVHHGMGDLPAAGAAWFGAGVKGPEVDAAVEAWRASYGDDFAAMWRSLPRSVRQEPRSRKVEALRAKALEARDASDAAASTSSGAVVPSGTGDSSGSGGIDAAQIIAWVIAAFVVVCAVVGLVQILRWMVPGG